MSAVFTNNNNNGGGPIRRISITARRMSSQIMEQVAQQVGVGVADDDFNDEEKQQLAIAIASNSSNRSLKKIDDYDDVDDEVTEKTNDSDKEEDKDTDVDDDIANTSASDSRSFGNPQIFVYLALPLIVGNLIDAFYDIVVSIFTNYQLDENTLDVILAADGEGQYDDIDDHSSSSFHLPSLRHLNVHGFGGHIAIMLMTFQFLSGLRMAYEGSNKKKENATATKAEPTTNTPSSISVSLIRQVHKRLGYFVAFSWTFAVITGATYLMTSERVKTRQIDWTDTERWGHKIFHIIGGIASLINMGNGILAVATRGDVAKKDYAKHKGSMYFAMYWITLQTYYKFAKSLLIMYLPCELDAATGFLSLTVFVSVEFTIYCILGHRYGGAAFRRPFVTYNILSLSTIIITTYCFLIVSLVTNPPESGCLAGLGN